LSKLTVKGGSASAAAAIGCFRRLAAALLGVCLVSGLGADPASGSEESEQSPNQRILSEARDALSVLGLISREAHYTAELWCVDLTKGENPGQIIDSLPAATVTMLAEERQRIVAAMEQMRTSFSSRAGMMHMRAEVREHRGRHLEHTWPAHAAGSPTTWLTTEQARAIDRRIKCSEFDVIVDPKFPPNGFVRITPGQFMRWEYDLTGLLSLFTPHPAFYGEQDVQIRAGPAENQRVLSYKTTRWGGRAIEDVTIAADTANLPVAYRASIDGRTVAQGRFYYSTDPGFAWPLAAVSLIGGEAGWRLQTSVFHEFKPFAATDPPLRLPVEPRMAMFEEIGGQRAFGYAGFPDRWPKSWGDLLELDGKPLVEEDPPPQPSKSVASRLIDIVPALLLVLASLAVLLLRSYLRKRTAASATGTSAMIALGLASLGVGCGAKQATPSAITVEMGTLAAGSQKVERRIVVSNTSASNWIVAEVERSCRCAVVGIAKGESVPAKSSRTVDVSFMPPSIPGPFEERIMIHYEGHHSAPQLILIRGTLEGLLQVNPRHLEFDVPMSGVVEKRVLLSVTSQDKLAGLVVRGQPAWLGVKVPTIDPQRQWTPSETWPIALTAKGHTLPESVRCEIEVVVTDTRGRESVLPVSVVARRGSALVADSTLLLLGDAGARSAVLSFTDSRPPGTGRTGSVAVVRTPSGIKAEVTRVDEERGVAQVKVSSTSPEAILGMIEVSAWGERLTVPIAAGHAGTGR
jgi:hypothetical protein